MMSVAISMVVKRHKKWNSMQCSWLQAIESSWARQHREKKKENWPWSFKVLSLASGNLWAKLAEFACHSHKTNVNEDRTNRVYVGPQNCPRILLWASLNALASISASTDPVQWYENLITYVILIWEIFVDSTDLPSDAWKIFICKVT